MKKLPKNKKAVILIGLIVIFGLGILYVFNCSVTCEHNTEVWAIKPRTTIENVIVYEAHQGDQFQYAGIYQDASGQEWYMVSGILKIDPNAGLDEGYILKESCTFGWSRVNEISNK